MIEQEFIAARRSKLTAFLEENPNLRCGPVVIIGQDLDYDRDFVRCVSFENDVFQRQFFVTDAGAFFDRPFDHVTGDACLTRFFAGGKKAGVPIWIGPAHLCCHHDFLHELAGDLALFQTGNFAFRMQPLAPHSPDVSGARRPHKRASAGYLRSPVGRLSGMRAVCPLELLSPGTGTGSP